MNKQIVIYICNAKVLSNKNNSVIIYSAIEMIDGYLELSAEDGIKEARGSVKKKKEQEEISDEYI